MDPDRQNVFRICVVVLVLLQICNGAPLASSLENVCRPCPPGLGVISKCNGTVDTQCETCSEGFYSNVTSTIDGCLVCSKCGEGLYELYPCNATHDVFCELCSWAKAIKNENYNSKCTEGQVDLGSEEDDYVNGIPADYFDYGKGLPFIADDVMLGDQPIVNTQAHVVNGDDDDEITKKLMGNDSVANIGDPENLDVFLKSNSTLPDNDDTMKNNVTSKIIVSDADDLGNVLNDTLTTNTNEESTVNYIKTNITTSVPPVIDSSTGIDVVNSSDLFPKNGISNTPEPIVVGGGDTSSGSDHDVQHISATIFGTDDGGSGSDDTTIIIPIDDEETETTKIPEEITTEFRVDTTSVHRRPPPPTTKLPTLPPRAVVSENAVFPENAISTEGVVIVPVHVPGEDGKDDKEEVLVYNVGESKEEDAIPIFAIIMAILTTGIIFFVLGFIFKRHRSGTVTYTPSQKYKRAPTKPPVENNYHEMKHLNSTTPHAPPPQITYTDEDDKPLNSPVKEEPKGPNGDVPSESLPLLPSDDTYPLGNHQSPVDIESDSAEVDDTLEKRPLVAKYIPENVNTITNTGTTIKVDYDCRDSTLTGGPLGSKRYCLNHVEIHWGGVDSRGSEHTINGIGYSAEIQLVHWNHDDCINYAHALSTEDGIAILSVLVEVPVGQNDHEGLKLLTDCLPSIQYKSESRHIPGGEFDAKRLLPDNMCDYWTYSGSLTSPPYHQSVTWIVFKDHVCVSHDQLERFRRLRTFERDEDHAQQPDGGFLADNYRYTMPLNDRKITASFI